jgi:hypothetical protein
MGDFSSFWSNILFGCLCIIIPMNREQNGHIDAHDNQSYGHSQATMELTPGMTPDELMEACPVDSCKEDNSLCINVLSGSMEPCPGNLLCPS